MHKYFNFTKIYEAEQMGAPLDPEEMGMPGSIPNAISTDKLEDFSKLANENILEITLTNEDCDDLKNGKSVSKKKPEAQWKNIDNETKVKDVELVILNTKNSTANNDEDALVFDLDEDTTRDILEGIKLGRVEQGLKALGQNGTIIPITVRFIKSVDLDISSTETVIPATPEQIEAGAVTPEATTGELPNESKGIMSFDQFVNEGKKKWIGDVTKDMKKGALKKELGGGKVTKAKIAEEEAKLKKKDKDKKKLGLQLDPKDAKTHKRDILARNLINAQKGKK